MREVRAGKKNIGWVNFPPEVYGMGFWRRRNDAVVDASCS